MTKTVREKYIETRVCEFAKKRGWLVYKWSSPNNRGVPDRIFVRDRIVILIEFKAPGKKPTPLQNRTHEKLRAEGMEVYVIDNINDGKDLLA